MAVALAEATPNRGTHDCRPDRAPDRDAHGPALRLGFPHQHHEAPEHTTPVLPEPREVALTMETLASWQTGVSQRVSSALGHGVR